MDKILIMADSHGLREEVEKIKKRHHVTEMIHCGDSELEADDPLVADMINVKGNCDFGPAYQEDHIVMISDRRYFITHGHLYDAKATLLPLTYRAEEVDAAIICFGHTHIAGAEKIAGRLFINPGSIRLPRKRREETYAILSIDEQNNATVQFYTVAGKEVKDLAYHTLLD